jgi:hypothetical protein
MKFKINVKSMWAVSVIESNLLCKTIHNNKNIRKITLKSWGRIKTNRISVGAFALGLVVA